MLGPLNASGIDHGRAGCGDHCGAIHMTSPAVKIKAQALGGQLFVRRRQQVGGLVVLHQ